jgi:hypothetical protein
MQVRSLAATVCLGLFVLLIQTATAKAAEIKLLCAIALQQLMEKLGPKFEGATRHKLTITITPLGQALKRLQDGEAYDIVILPQRGIEGLAKDRKAVGSTAQAAIMLTAKESEPLNALINFLRGPEALGVIKTMGMEPG